MAKNNQNTTQPKNQAQKPKQTQEVKEQSKQEQQKPKSSQKKPKKYRSVSRFVEVFEHKGVRYTIHPNSVVENLPEDAPQVQRLIKEGKLVEVK
ncbi:hypothetical protein [Desulfurobacterium sp.]